MNENIFFEVVNFEQYQHYKDRTPPWIKLYNDLLDDYEFACLQDASKLHQIMIWLLASRSNNKIPYDPEYIKRRINATEDVNLGDLLSAGFIRIIGDDSGLLAERLQSARPEKEREGETEGDIKKETPIGVSKKDRAQTKKGTRLQFQSLPTEWLSWASSEFPRMDAYGVFDEFRDYWVAQPGQKGVKTDWLATWRNWCRRENKNGGKHNGAATNYRSKDDIQLERSLQAIYDESVR